MPIANRSTPEVAQAISDFTVPEQKQINDALDQLEHDYLAPGYTCSREMTLYGDASRTIEVGSEGIRIDYKYDSVGLVTIIDIYRSSWHVLKVLFLDFSP